MVMSVDCVIFCSNRFVRRLLGLVKCNNRLVKNVRILRVIKMLKCCFGVVSWGMMRELVILIMVGMVV